MMPFMSILDYIFGGARAKYVAKMDINGIIFAPHKMAQSLQERLKNGVRFFFFEQPFLLKDVPVRSSELATRNKNGAL